MNPIAQVIEFSEMQKDIPSPTSERSALEEVRKIIRKGRGFVIIKGLRGSGKTTLLRTIARETKSLLTSGDFLRIKGIGLEEVVKAARLSDARWILIDEVHLLDKWKLKLKVAVDTWGHQLGFIVTGSSALQLERASDLKRRAKVIHLNDFSFQEFLRIKGIEVDVHERMFKAIFNRSSLEKVFYDLIRIQSGIDDDYLKYYREFLNNPLPALLETEDKRYRLREIIYSVIDEDITKIEEDLTVKSIHKAKDILNYLSVAEKTSLQAISNNTGLSKGGVSKILDLLEKAGLIIPIHPASPKSSLRGMRKYMFPAPMFRRVSGYLLQETGFEREDLFVKVIRSWGLPIAYEYSQRYGFDYLVSKRAFEVGGKGKGRKGERIIVCEGCDLDYNGRTLTIPLEFFSLMERSL